MRAYLLAPTILWTYAWACLSNPRHRCSIASYMGHSAGCQQIQLQQQQLSYSGGDGGGVAQPQYAQYTPSMYQTGQYHGFLGDSVQARAYSENGGNDFAKQDNDLKCQNMDRCRWRNDPNDELEWVSGSGTIDPMKLALITGSNIQPEPSFLILASDPRPALQGGSLISPPIGCQQSSGLLSFRMWRSRARKQGQEPNIDICTRRLPDITLENCLTVEITDNHTIIASIPPILEPFEVVLRGYGFANDPEGGLLLIDGIDYFAHVDNPENCITKDFGKAPEIIPFVEDENDEAPPEFNKNRVVSSDTGEDDESEVVEERDPVFRSSKSHLLSKKTDSIEENTIVLNEDSMIDGCRALHCNFDETGNPCGYARVGENARGMGFTTGWKVAHVGSNMANKLTGIHSSPGDPESHFLIADFPGFERMRKEQRFVLESPDFSIPKNAEAFLGFRKYLSTQGIEMSVCEDPNSQECFWDNFQHSSDPFARAWTMEIVKLPSRINKFFIICAQDLNATANVGQVGISEIGLYSDAEGSKSLC